MSMRIKHFAALAKIIADERAAACRSDESQAVIDAIMYRLASFCAENSSTFDRTRFIAAASEGRVVKVKKVRA